MRRSPALGLGLALAALLATPAQADTVTIAGIDAVPDTGQPGWDKPVVDIKPGDTVEWTFANTVQFHNVAIEFPQGPVRTPGGVPAPPFSQAFPEAGTYPFLCEVHKDTMRGVVRVSAVPAPPPPPPPLSAQPFNNDAAAALPAESNVALDRSRPRLSSVSARRIAKGAARVRFRVSEASDVRVSFRRGGRMVKSAVASGTGRRSLAVRGLKRGRYTVRVRATDVAGNRSSVRSLRLNVR